MEFPREAKAMTSKRQNRSDSRHSTAALRADYSALLLDIKNRIRTAQIRASSSVNRELIQLYWDIGHLIGERQRAQGWGRSVSSGWPRTFRRVSLEWRDSHRRTFGRCAASFWPGPRRFDFSHEL